MCILGARSNPGRISPARSNPGRISPGRISPRCASSAHARTPDGSLRTDLSESSPSHNLTGQSHSRCGDLAGSSCHAHPAWRAPGRQDLPRPEPPQRFPAGFRQRDVSDRHDALIRPSAGPDATPGSQSPGSQSRNPGKPIPPQASGAGAVSTGRPHRREATRRRPEHDRR